MRVFLAGATGVIGLRLVPLLVEGGHTVIGTTRDPTFLRDWRVLAETAFPKKFQYLEGLCFGRRLIHFCALNA